MFEHAAWKVSKIMVNHEGRTSWGLMHGREARERIAEFGEKVHYVPLTGSHNRRGKLNMRDEVCIFLGIKLSTEEALIGINKGCNKG